MNNIYFIIFQLGISLFGSISFLLVIRDSKRCQKIGTIFGLISNPFWWGMLVITEQWFSIPVYLLYTYGWLSKAWSLFRKESIKNL